MKLNVAILGASQDHSRFSYKAFQMLKDYGHTPFPVSPKLSELDGTNVVPKLSELPQVIDTLTMYVNPQTSSSLEKEILELNPRRIIFNPGSENPLLMQKLQNNGVEVIEACTLVLLQTNNFE